MSCTLFAFMGFMVAMPLILIQILITSNGFIYKQ